MKDTEGMKNSTRNLFPTFSAVSHTVSLCVSGSHTSPRKAVFYELLFPGDGYLGLCCGLTDHKDSHSLALAPKCCVCLHYVPVGGGAQHVVALQLSPALTHRRYTTTDL